MTTTSCKKEAPSGAFSIEYLREHLPQFSEVELELALFCLKHNFNNLFIEVRNDIYRYNFKQNKEANLSILTHGKEFVDKLINKLGLTSTPTHIFALGGANIIVFYLACYPNGFDIQIKCLQIEKFRKLLNASELNDKLNKELNQKYLHILNKI